MVTVEKGITDSTGTGCCLNSDDDWDAQSVCRAATTTNKLALVVISFPRYCNQCINYSQERCLQ